MFTNRETSTEVLPEDDMQIKMELLQTGWA